MLMKSFKIGNVTIPSRAILAPMAGFSDVALRHLAKEYGAGLTYTEMVSAKALDYKNDKTKVLLANVDESPIAVQIFGSEPEVMARVIKSGVLDAFDIIDINMGCPTPKIVKNGDGSALLNDFAKAEKIIKACKASTDKPITVKFRIGITSKNIIAVEFAQMCERAGADAITVHGRTVEQGYSGKNNLDVIKMVVDSVKIPVIASGDCTDKKMFDYIINYTGAAAVMIGRAAIGNPEIFAECNNKIVKADKYSQIKEHIRILQKFYPEKVIVLNMRGVACHYLKKLQNTSSTKIALSKVNTLEELYAVLDVYFA